MAPPINANSTGFKKFFLRLDQVAFRQAMMGPIPISAYKANPIGTLT